MGLIQSVKLNNGVETPQLGFGTFQIDRVDTVLAAFEAGYRHFDTAPAYGNEAEVGQAIAESGLGRDEIFLTTKLHWTRHGYDAALAALDESLTRLRWHIQLGNITLIKWANPARIRENIALFDFDIDEADMRTMAGLDGDPDGAPSKTALATLAKWEPSLEKAKRP